MSWDEVFADCYEEWSAHMTADIAFYTELAVKADGPLVELAIGNGRVAIPVARATGQRVIGIDSSPVSRLPTIAASTYSSPGGDQMYGNATTLRRILKSQQYP